MHFHRQEAGMIVLGIVGAVTWLLGSMDRAVLG